MMKLKIKNKSLLKQQAKDNAQVTKGASKNQIVLKEGNCCSISDKIVPHTPAVIGINKGVTKNMDNYESLRVDVWCSTPLEEGLSIEEGYSELNEVIDEVLTEIVSEYLE